MPNDPLPALRETLSYLKTAMREETLSDGAFRIVVMYEIFPRLNRDISALERDAVKMAAPVRTE
jgi:hypothetical protein